MRAARPRRIAVVHWTGRQVGGAEQYVSTLLPLLQEAGHEVALLAETDEPLDHDRFALPSGAERWVVSELGFSSALARLRAWRPELIFCQLTLDLAVEAAVLDVAPAVRFAHGYHGVCITAAKTNRRPHVRPCERTFGPACLALFYPKRCGGLNPLVMLDGYREHMRRRDLLARYQAIVTNSDHLRAEYVRNGCDPDRVHAVPMPVAVNDAGSELFNLRSRGGCQNEDAPCSLLYVGRMDDLKGGLVLLEALPLVRAALGRDVRLVLAGDGPDRERWERRAGRVTAVGPGIEIEFAGRLAREGMTMLYAEADLLVVPSLWPEPFGLVGAEAGIHGVPAAAFRVGGIPEWLRDGVNGHLAEGTRLNAANLAEAIVRCVKDPHHHERLRRGAREVARRFSGEAHLLSLEPILEAAASSGEDVAIGQNTRPSHV